MSPLRRAPRLNFPTRQYRIERVLGETAGGKPQADRNLLNIMIESILMVFVIGGIVDALHLGKPHERRPVPIPAQRPQPGRQRRF